MHVWRVSHSPIPQKCMMSRWLQAGVGTKLLMEWGLMIHLSSTIHCLTARIQHHISVKSIFRNPLTTPNLQSRNSTWFTNLQLQRWVASIWPSLSTTSNLELPIRSTSSSPRVWVTHFRFGFLLLEDTTCILFIFFASGSGGGGALLSFFWTFTPCEDDWSYIRKNNQYNKRERFQTLRGYLAKLELKLPWSSCVSPWNNLLIQYLQYPSWYQRQ